MTLTADPTVVRRLSVRGVGGDTPALRDAIAGCVAAADVRPRGLPPAAILTVRRAEVGVALRPSAGGGSPRPGAARADPRWEQACRDDLAEAASAAIRPARGALPDSALAVLFRDEAELLACLAVDLASGVSSRRWWWRLLLPALPAGADAGTAALLAGHAEAAPAVLAELHAWDRATDVVATIDDGGACVVLATLAAAHGVPALVDAAAALAAHAPAVQDPAERAGADSDAAAPTASADGPQPDGMSRSDEAAPPGPIAAGRTLPSADAPWAAGIALAPAAARLGAPQRVLLATALLLHDRPQAVRARGFAAALRDWVATTAARPEPSARRYRRDEPSAHAPDTAPPADPETDPLPAPPGDAAHATAPPSGGSPPESARLWRGAEPDPAATPASGERHDLAAEEEEGVVTHLAGALCLVNILRRLDLLDEEVETALGAWGALDALARGLLADPPDPLWALLARLGGREPGEPIGPGSLVSAPADAPLLAPLGAYARAWLGRTLPRVRPWLAGALELADHEAVDELLVRRGTVHATRTHVDVAMTLDAISLPVRRAGLDADPGWDAAFGRVVRLHYRDAR